MTGSIPDLILCYMLMLCRIGACLMFMPGFSSPRVPQQVRAFLAIAGTLALAPILMPTVSAAIAGTEHAAPLQMMMTEVTIGALIGLMGRFFWLALEFMTTAIASSIGFNIMPGAPVEHTDPVPPLSSLITLTATALFFITDLHWEVLRGLLASYRILPIGKPLTTEFTLAQMADALGKAFQLTLQIAGPFFLYSIAVNYLFGIANKLTPQIATYFISAPFVLAGGLLLLYLLIADFMRLFITGFMTWLENG